MDPKLIPLFDKRDFLKTLNEDAFRDLVIRPLFLRKGFHHGAELCGPTEAGKDCYFTQQDPFGCELIYAVQTKIGNLNLGRKPAANLVQAITQLKTAMATKILDSKSKSKKSPNFAFLCTSGIISPEAKEHIISESGISNLRFLDVDDLIPEIDNHYGEYWSGIAADKYPYLTSLSRRLMDEKESFALSGLLISEGLSSPVSDEGFAPLRLTRTYLKAKRNPEGKITKEPEFETIGVEGLISRHGSRYMVIGEAGSGKTTALKRVAEVMAKRILDGDDTVPTPVIIRAVDALSTNDSIADYIIKHTEQFTLSGKAAFGAGELIEGKVLLLIDALDEIGSRSLLNIFVTKLIDFDKNYPDVRVILSGRNYSYIKELSALSNYATFDISPLGWKEADKIIKNVAKNKNLQREKPKEIMRQLEKIHGFELNPLLVTVFAASADSSRKDIPSNVTELFAKFTETMLGRWDSSKGLSQQHESTLKALLLQKIAFQMHRGKTCKIPTVEFRRIIETELTDVGAKDAKIDALMEEITVRSGLIREIDGQTEFRHLLIQEFFAGRGIPDDEILHELVRDEWWRRALVFYFGTNPSNGVGLRRICESTNSTDPDILFNIAVTVGLGVQACYFVKIAPKVEILKWVIHALAVASNEYLQKLADSESPLHTFLFSYLIARDSVGADCLNDVLAEVRDSPHLDSIAELETFWLIVGLMEAGYLEDAFAMIKKYHPTHRMPLLALHLGAFFIEKVRSVSKEDKAIAKAIGERLQPSVVVLKDRFLKEFKSMLVEFQKGVVKELPEESE